MKNNIIHFYGPISILSFDRLKDIVLKALFPDPQDKSITILLSSEGGDINTGFTAYNFFRSLPVPVTMINMGTIESMAVPIYLSANSRLSLENSRFLLHSFHWGFNAGTCDYLRLAEHSLSLDIDSERYAKIFEERTKGAETPVNIRECLSGRAQILIAATSAPAVTSVSASSAGIVTGLVTYEEIITGNSVQWWVNTCG